MKQILWIVSVAFFALSASSCSEDDCDNKESDAAYYVRYEASSGNPQTYLESITISTDTGTQRVALPANSIRNWSSATYGPVSKGFKTEISIYPAGNSKVSKIYVCKEKAPFALKRTGGAAASYVIDF